MKKTFAFVCACLFGLAVTGCPKPAEKPAEPATEPAAEAPAEEAAPEVPAVE